MQLFYLALGMLYQHGLEFYPTSLIEGRIDAFLRRIFSFGYCSKLHYVPLKVTKLSFKHYHNLGIALPAVASVYG